MECMEARALKSSFSSEIAMKSTNSQSILDDFWCITGLPSEDFSIDEFFDLPNEENNIDEEEEKDSSSVSLSSSQEHVDDFNSNSTNFSTDFAIPVDDVQELELWSHFLDDSILEPTLACPNLILDTYKGKTGFNLLNRIEPEYKPDFLRVPVFSSAVPVKPRSKRSRTNVNRSWIFISSPKTESSSSSSSSSSPISTLFFPPPVYEMGMFFNYGKTPTKKPKKKPAVVSSLCENPQVQRRCSHCQVTKTPQWRAGPNGPKTLCNACGVRFKSGRLFPEYRPACSPTFSNEIHSNSHRRVLEMRKKKVGCEPMSGSPPTVLSS